MIVLATDLSDESLEAAKWAKAFALLNQTLLRAVYVVEHEFFELPGAAPLLADEGIARKLEKRVRERLTDVLGDFDFEVELREGRAQNEIAEASRGASLLVLGKPADGVTRFALGSVPERLCHNPATPVAVVRPDRPWVEHPTWVVGLDFSAQSVATLTLAVELARQAKAHLSLVHVVPVPSPTVVSDANIMQIELDSLPLAEARKWAKERMESFLEENAGLLDGIVYNAEIIEGYPLLSLAEVAKRYEADAILVGTAGRTSLGDRLMGSVAFGLVKRMPSTIILAPPAHGEA